MQLFLLCWVIFTFQVYLRSQLWGGIPPLSNFLDREILERIDRMEIRIMTALADLQAASTLEASAIATIGQAVTDAANRVSALQSTLSSNPDEAAVEAVALDLGTHASTLSQIAAALTAIAPAATVVTPPANPVSAAPAEAAAVEPVAEVTAPVVTEPEPSEAAPTEPESASS